MKGPLRFCMVTTFYPPYSFGGDAMFVHRLSNELAGRGHHVEVIHCVDAYRALAPAMPTRGYDDHPNVTVHGLESRFGILSPMATQQTGRPYFKSAAIRRILDRGFDVIHYHNPSLVGGPKILEYGSGIKLYTMHEYWLVCPTHVLFRFNRAPCKTRHCLACTLAHRRPPQWWRASSLLPSAVRHVDRFLAPSRFIMRKHEYLGLDAPLLHMPYFVPEPRTTPDVAPTSLPAEPYFLFVGRIEKVKGLHTLIPLFRRHGKAVLLVAGRGADEAYLRRQANGAANIRFLGHTSGAALRALYRGATAVVVPSICFDNSPLVTIEAFMHGTPVIARDLGGMSEMIEDSGGGAVYETDDQLMAAMDRMLAEPDHRKELGDRARRFYETYLTPDAHLGRYFGLIDDLSAASG